MQKFIHKLVTYIIPNWPIYAFRSYHTPSSMSHGPVTLNILLSKGNPRQANAYPILNGVDSYNRRPGVLTKT